MYERLTVSEKNARIVKAAFPNVFSTIFSLWLHDEKTRKDKLARAARDARKLGWKISATGEPYPTQGYKNWNALIFGGSAT